MRVAVDEACANIVQHAYAGMVPGDMVIRCEVQGETFTIRIRDWGRAFDPDQVEVPNIKGPLEDRGLGGLGLFMIRQLMDRATYRSDPNHGNELVMVKRTRGASQ